VVRDVITSLEDKRALYVGAVYEQPDHVVRSVQEIRQELTAGLKRVGDGSPARGAFRAMRAACREFLTHPVVESGGHAPWHHHGSFQQEEFLIGLGKLRSVFGQQIALLGYLYGIDIEEQLASTLPPSPDKNDGE
jgi:hypothetical protein